MAIIVKSGGSLTPEGAGGGQETIVSHLELPNMLC